MTFHDACMRACDGGLFRTSDTTTCYSRATAKTHSPAHTTWHQLFLVRSELIVWHEWNGLTNREQARLQHAWQTALAASTTSSEGGNRGCVVLMLPRWCAWYFGRLSYQK
jgi:hypothetical protein